MGIVNRIKRLESQMPMDSLKRQAAVREIEGMMDRLCEQYNNPEEVEKRHREYEELQEIGRKRRDAFYAGIPIDTYPLPWELKGENNNDRPNESVFSERTRISEWLKTNLGSI